MSKLLNQNGSNQYLMNEKLDELKVKLSQAKSIIDMLEESVKELSSFQYSTSTEKNEQITDKNELIKLEEVASILAVSKVTIYKWKKKGIIPFYRVGSRIYFKMSDIKKLTEVPSNMSKKLFASS